MTHEVDESGQINSIVACLEVNGGKESKWFVQKK